MVARHPRPRHIGALTATSEQTSPVDALHLFGTTEHLAMRKARSQPILKTLRVWIDDERPKHLPEGFMGTALRYINNQWQPLTEFMKDSKLPIHNNASESRTAYYLIGEKEFTLLRSRAGRTQLLRPLLARPDGRAQRRQRVRISRGRADARPDPPGQPHRGTVARSMEAGLTRRPNRGTSAFACTLRCLLGSPKDAPGRPLTTARSSVGSVKTT